MLGWVKVYHKETRLHHPCSLAEWKERRYSVRVRNQWPAILAFADDVYLFARSRDHAHIVVGSLALPRVGSAAGQMRMDDDKHGGGRGIR